ncbi:TPA: hypothetical protein N0F65_007002, partial [Lagenidium giganteum]
QRFRHDSIRGSQHDHLQGKHIPRTREICRRHHALILRHKDGALDKRMLVLVGTPAAVDGVFHKVMHIIKEARTQLQNRSRADHSWTLTSSGHSLTPRTVHHTGQRAPKFAHATGKNHYTPKKISKRAEAEKSMAAALLRAQTRR